MRLSLMKAAQAVVGQGNVQEIRVRASARGSGKPGEAHPMISSMAKPTSRQAKDLQGQRLLPG